MSIELNRIYQMDCIEGMRMMSDESVDLILTDIPYGGVTKKGADRSKYGGQLRKLDKGVADIVLFDIQEFLKEIDRLCSGSIYVFCGISQISQIYDYFESRSKDYMIRLCVWKKSNPSPMNGQHMWLNGAEFCVFAKKRKQTFNEKCKSSVWEFPIGRSKIHPTEKPLKLFEYLVNASSNEGETVLDTCMGSGTTAIAAIRSNRNFIGFELEPKYVEVANQRILNEFNEKGTKND